jgi:hypothetical protein
MSPRRLLLDDGDPSASRADQSAAALHDTSENSSANQQFCLGQSPAALQRVGQSAATTQRALKCAGQSAASFSTFAT